MMYFLDYAMYQGALKAAQEEFELGRKLTKQELIANANEGGIRLVRKKVEAATDYSGHRDRLCDRADDLGLLHACTDTWLEVRTWNNDIRGVLTLFGLAAYSMFWGMATLPDWLGVIRLYQTGLWTNGKALTSSTPFEWLISAIGATIQERRQCPACDRPTERGVHDCGTSTVHVGGLRGMDNDLVNLIATVVGAAVAAWLPTS